MTKKQTKNNYRKTARHRTLRVFSFSCNRVENQGGGNNEQLPMPEFLIEILGAEKKKDMHK